MDWLEHDEVEPGALPAWAREGPAPKDGGTYEVRICPEGLVLIRGRKASAIRWEDILVPIHLDAPIRLLVSCARRPPRTPWFEIGGVDVGEIERAVTTRLDAIEHRGYRDRRRRLDPISADEVLTRVLERSPLPGAVEIPAATPSIVRSAALGATVGGATFALYGLLFGPLGALAAGGVGALGGGAVMGGIEQLRKRAAGRVLVLTPDAFVAGLDGASVRAVSWARVGRFSEGADDAGTNALEVFSKDHVLEARVAAHFFGAPLDVIVAVAEAYRKRVIEE
jgi:hypothetical protein